MNKNLHLYELEKNESRYNLNKKLLIFHPALAPYRVDFFNALSNCYNTKIYFFNENLISQKFDQEKLKEKLNIKPNYLSLGFKLGKRIIRFGLLMPVIQFKPNIIFVSEYHVTNWFLIIWRFFSSNKYKIVSICDDNIYISRRQSFVKKLNRKLQLNYLDALVLTHSDIVEWYKKSFTTRTKFIQIPLVQNENVYLKELNSSLSVSTKFVNEYNLYGKKVILYVGRLVNDKNLSFLLKGFSEINLTDKSAVLVIVGSGENEDSLRKEVQIQNLSHYVIFTGRLEGAELLAWFNIGTIFVLASTYEPFGAVVNEALLAGCYTLCSNQAGASSLIFDNENGEIFNPNNKVEFVEKLGKALKYVEFITFPVVLRKSLMKGDFNCLVVQSIERLALI